jgi:hypothetical protein
MRAVIAIKLPSEPHQVATQCWSKEPDILNRSPRDHGSEENQHGGPGCASVREKSCLMGLWV